MWWSATSSVLTGRKVPAPTCRVTKFCETPLAFSAASSSQVKCRPALGADIGRQRDVAVFGDGGVEVGAGQVEAKGQLAALALDLDHSVQHPEEAGAVVALAEADAVADLETLARAHEGGPGVGREPSVQHRLDPYHLSVTLTGPVEARGDHAGVVEH
jgi:hypothetical protein